MKKPDAISNYPARGIGNTTIEAVAANHYKRSILRLCKTLIKLETECRNEAKLLDFVTMIQSFQVINENQDAFFLTDHVSKNQDSFKN
jgi:DNA helicase-2/ATP-dependent DNA helicase PcrA